MAIDRQDDDDSPAITVRPAEIAADGLSAKHPGSGVADDADRTAYHISYRETVDGEYRAAARERWNAARQDFETQWHEHAQRHPHPPGARPSLDTAVITKVMEGCDRIAETEENVVTPAMLRIEAEDPERRLAGLDHRRKGEGRIMEKVAAAIEEQLDLSPEEALASVKDAIRYTFQYNDERYSDGVRADIERLKDAGFELVELRNSWEREEYKGINSRWRVTENSQLFEVQFHTRISFDAKQLTHPAYELIRNPTTSPAELRELRAFQREVSTEVPTPPGAKDLPRYP